MPIPLQIRPAQASDRDAVFAFCARIWEGHDYLPSVWDEWLNDPRGILLAALQDGVPVGVARAAFPRPQEAWLEGMRVDPDYGGAGIATALSLALLEACRQRGARVARLLTMAHTLPVHRLCARLGFALLLRLRQRFCPLRVGPAPAALRRLVPGDLPLAQELLSRPARGRPFLEVTRGLYSQGGGVWSPWNEARLAEHLAGGQVWTWEGERGPRAIAVVNPHRRRAGVFEVALLEGPGPDCTALLAALRWRDMLPLVETGTPPGVRVPLPVDLVRLQRAALRAGYRLVWREQLYVYEKTLE